jgi:hypothetical protein
MGEESLHEINSVSWGVFLTADGAVTLAHMGIGSFSDAVAAFNELTPDHAGEYAEDVRNDIPSDDRTDSALSVTLGLPDHWVGGTTEWGWIITRATQ